MSIESLDLSNNKAIEKACYKQFGEHILEVEKYQKLSSLSLEGNMIGDDTLDVLLNSLKYNLGVTFLNLSQNNITELGAKTIKHFLSSNNTIRVLFLHWNKLGLQGSKRIAKSLITNSVLQVLDLSFCQLGTHKKPSARPKPQKSEDSPVDQKGKSKKKKEPKAPAAKE